jgi:hypothetical protein
VIILILAGYPTATDVIQNLSEVCPYQDVI